jgi:hypothetical protein
MSSSRVEPGLWAEYGRDSPDDGIASEHLHRRPEDLGMRMSRTPSIDCRREDSPALASLSSHPPYQPVANNLRAPRKPHFWYLS